MAIGSTYFISRWKAARMPYAGRANVRYPSVWRVSTPLLNMKAGPILSNYLRNTRIKASSRLIDMLKRSCMSVSKRVFPASNISHIKFFCQDGLKNLKISYDFLVKSLVACSLQKPPIVVSFAEATNMPTVSPFFSECSS